MAMRLTRKHAQAGLDPEARARQLAKLEARYARRPEVSEKLLMQQEVGHMRDLLDDRDRSVTYPVNPPYAFVEIRFDRDAGEYRYHLREPTLKRGEHETLAAIRDRLEAETNQHELPIVSIERLSESAEVTEFLWRKFLDVVDLYDFEVPEDRLRAFYYYLHRDLVSLGRADGVLRDPFVEDVSCNGTGVPLYVFHRVFGSVRTSVQYDDAGELNRYILKLAQSAGKHVSVYQPILDATLQDGSRINLTMGTEVTKKGSTFSIRKFAQDPISPVDLILFGSAEPEQFAYFWSLIEAKRSILISGGTASGKTTLLNAIGMFIRPEDKVVSIEDTPEIHLSHENWIQSVSRAGYGARRDGGQSGAIELFDLLVAALRQRPEFMLVGEVRGQEAFNLFQAISTGHAAMATIHAASVDELLNRMESDPMNIPRPLIQSLDCVAFPAQVIHHGRRARRLRMVSEMLEVDSRSGNLLTNDVYAWNADSDRQEYRGRSYVLEDIARSTGRPIQALEAELARKAGYLRLLVDLKMTAHDQVSRAIADYYVDPEAAVQRMEERLTA